MKALFFTALLIVTSYASSDEPRIVKVASLTVKDRIQSIEEINVTAKNQSADIPTSNVRIEKILVEAKNLEARSSSRWKANP